MPFIRREDWGRIRRVVRRVENLPPPGLYNAQHEQRYGYVNEEDEQDFRNPAPYHFWVKVTGERIEPGYYPGVTVYLEDAAAVPSPGSAQQFQEDPLSDDPLDASNLCWIRTPALAELEVDAILWGYLYEATTLEAAEDPEELRAVYMVDDGCAACTGTWECQPVPVGVATYAVDGTGFGGITGCTDYNILVPLTYDSGSLHPTIGPGYFSEPFTARGISQYWALWYDSTNHRWFLQCKRATGFEDVELQFLWPTEWDEASNLVLPDDYTATCTIPATITVIYTPP